MLKDIRQVLRLIMLTGKLRRHSVLRATGGLLVLFWTETGNSVQIINCTVAAAGLWCAGTEMKALQLDLKKSMSCCMWPCPEPDPEELSAFTDLYGSLRLLLSFQMKDIRHYTPDWQAHIQTFLQAFSLANAGIKIYLKFKLKDQTLLREIRVKLKRKVAQADQSSVILDVSSSAQPPHYVKKGCWCQGGHPVIGGKLPLSIPPQAMDQGLFGELSVQLVTLLNPCVLQYPNLPTELTTIQVLVYNPSNIPVPGPSGFFQNLPSALDCQQLGLDRLDCSSFKGCVHSIGTIYTVEQENWDDPEQESSHSSHLPVPQSLLLFLFLQHSDPFISQVTDLIAADVLIEHHLEDILSNNKQAVTAALQTELWNTMKAQNHRKKQQGRLHSAAEVILSSTISIVSCSSNMDFRNACLKRMKAI
ncbi:DUF4554 domain-containing protein isoform X2 [Melanotaenia boesemani]|uniref:DUF4554 domain-containing protein isoform X2 n=1 Tax=Melanotaenia boesemani TaxID=1250792 RepID=UPI001C04E64B|nr:DUF4554 domain-containing protein isoform X2 [Melanotaenia boesemani]